MIAKNALSVFLLVTLTQSSVSAQTCKSPYVWREAFEGDHICVTVTTRTDAGIDNSLAESRRDHGPGRLGPDTCRTPFIWRRAFEGDLVCVDVDTARRVASDNRLARDRQVTQPWEGLMCEGGHRCPPTDMTCKSGFVWRMAGPADFVCVEPEQRAKAVTDNQLRADPARRGNDACQTGFVWRDAGPHDFVCVSPETRDQAAFDNSQAEARIVQNTPSNTSSPPTSHPGSGGNTGRDRCCYLPEVGANGSVSTVYVCGSRCSGCGGCSP